MPFKDPEDRRRYDRERKRHLRAAIGTPSPLAVPAEVRVRVAEDVGALLAEAVREVRSDRTARGVERGRALGYLASVGMRLIEVHDQQERLEALERMLYRPKLGTST